MTRSNREAEQALDAIETWARWLGEPAPLLIPAHDIRPYQGLSPHADISEKRALGLGRLATGQSSLVVTPVAAAASRLESPEFYRSLARPIRTGMQFASKTCSNTWKPSAISATTPSRWSASFRFAAAFWTFTLPRHAARCALSCSGMRSSRSANSTSTRSVPSGRLAPRCCCHSPSSRCEAISSRNSPHAIPSRTQRYSLRENPLRDGNSGAAPYPSHSHDA